MSPCDPAAFDSDAAPFSPKQWLNEALSAPALGGDEEPLELRLSVLLTKLQLSAADVDASVHSSCKELGSISRPVARELGLVSQQAAAVRAELSTLLDEVGSLEERSEASVCHLREGMSIKTRFANAANTLRQAERVATLLRTAESSFSRGDASAAASGVAQLGSAFESLGTEELRSLFPEASARVEGLRKQLLAKLRPELLQAVREHDSAAMLRLSGLFSGLGSAEAARDAYVQCAQAPLFESWNAARRMATAGEAVGALWKCVEARVPAERAWVASVFRDDTALLPRLLGEALEDIGPQMQHRILEALPDTAEGSEGEGGEGGDAVVSELSELWADALRRGSILGDELGGAKASGVPRVLDAMLLPFEPAQRRFAPALTPAYARRLPPIPPPPADASRRAVAHAAAIVERTALPLYETVLAAAAAATRFGGTLGAAGTCDLVCTLVETHGANLAAALPLLDPAAEGVGTEANGAAAMVVGGRSSLESAEEGSVEESRDSLSLLRAVHTLRERIAKLEGAVADILRRSAAACEAAPLQTAAHREAASDLLSSLPPRDAPPGGLLPRAVAVADALLRRVQRLALEALSAPISAAVRVIASSDLSEVWRGGGEESGLSSALLTFSASPQLYITQLGEHLLGLPHQLEPYANGPTLSLLVLSTATDGSPAAASPDDRSGALLWLDAIGGRAVDLMLGAISHIPALSPLGANQLAADAAYVENILTGLGVQPDARLPQLNALLTASTAELPAAVDAASALPAALAAAIAAKRGVQLPP